MREPAFPVRVPEVLRRAAACGPSCRKGTWDLSPSMDMAWVGWLRDKLQGTGMRCKPRYRGGVLQSCARATLKGFERWTRSMFRSRAQVFSPAAETMQRVGVSSWRSTRCGLSGSLRDCPFFLRPLLGRVLANRVM